MKNKINNLFGCAVMLSIIAVVMVISVPQASAYEVNITTGPDLTIGSTGQGVVVLQGLLSELGYLNIPVGVPEGYFGNLTKNAVAAYQAARGVAPTAGYFGPLTKIAMHQQFATHNWLALLGW